MINKTKVVGELARFMDDFHKLWFIRFGEWLINNDHVNQRLRTQFNGLKRSFYGGGSPTMELFAADQARNPLRKVSELISFARECTREDLGLVLQNIDSEMEIRNLDLKTKGKIADYLDFYNPVIEYWESLATQFGFTQEDQTSIKNSAVVPCSFSPTKKLFELLLHENENLPVGLIIKWAESESLNNIVQIIYKYESQVVNL